MEECIEGILSKSAVEKPPDIVKPEDAGSLLPEWFDEKQYNRQVSKV